MDFIKDLPWLDGYTVILVVVDRLSKYAHFIPLQHLYTIVTIAMTFMRKVVCLHGILESIVMDQDKFSLSHF